MHSGDRVSGMPASIPLIRSALSDCRFRSPPPWVSLLDVFITTVLPFRFALLSACKTPPPHT